MPLLITLLLNYRGTNSIHMYTVSRQSGHLDLLSITISPRPGDGPRHVIVSPDGNVLYSVTEHSSVYSHLRSSMAA